MASKKIFHSRANSFFIASGLGDARIKSSTNAIPEDSFFEFDESDIWSGSNAISSMESRKILPNSRVSSKKVSRKIESAATERSHVTCSSLPVNIPDWSKIYKEERKGREGDIADEDTDFEDDVDEDHDGRLPPHEYLARRRGASFSVHEGIGRTLKGRDLRQVRNAIWKQVGFED
ncbi:hypothetical protein K2173_002154 [Erythroxylum novogranatense]|uniref:Senescence regulator n=1 Tax=Erythroxylum novogranatense TaxID=1862640 RepID=A0AAV8SQL1_9ROSI|nr:hypothetical protein K2173_002154 [Erythroxylum novogranatense]